MRVAHLRFAVTALAAAVALAFIIKQIVASSGAAPDVERAFVVAGALTKLAALAVAAVFAARVTAGVGRGNGARGAWLLLAAGLSAMAVGQAVLTGYQIVTGKSLFPSLADVAFVLSYPLLIAAVIALLRAYAAAGFAMDGQRTVAVIASACAIAIAVPLLAPIARSAGTPLEKALNLAYPALDLILAVPAILLLRSANRFRGGAVWKIWAALLAGILLTAAGDVLFAWLSILGQTQLDAAVHALYILAYGGMAVGVLYQQEILQT